MNSTMHTPGKRKSRLELKELLMLLLLKLEGPVGRYRLKHMLGMTEHEGVVKLMLADLRQTGHISSNKLGSKLTIKGENLLNQRLKNYSIVTIEDVNISPLEVGLVSVGIHLKGKTDTIKSGIEQRDATVRAGATGATILTYKDGVLGIPKVYPDISSKYPNLNDQIHRLFNLVNRDVLIITSATDRWRALEGALAAAKILT